MLPSWHARCTLTLVGSVGMRSGIYESTLPAMALLLGLALGLATGCGGRQPNVAADGAGSQQPPFTESKPTVVPADTVVYVRLQQSLTSAAKVGQSFSAILDEPLLADDQEIAQRGTEVTGTIMAARASGRVNSAGYVRIVLSSMTVNGRVVPLQTASIIAGGANIRNHDYSFLGNGAASSFQETGRKSQAGFAAGQRLGFRLTQPLSF